MKQADTQIDRSYPTVLAQELVQVALIEQNCMRRWKSAKMLYKTFSSLKVKYKLLKLMYKKFDSLYE